jgi:hypothetical protein
LLLLHNLSQTVFVAVIIDAGDNRGRRHAGR